MVDGSTRIIALGTALGIRNQKNQRRSRERLMSALNLRLKGRKIFKIVEKKTL